MSSSVFISYRRDDVAAEAHSIANLVKERVGEDSVFFDTSSIYLGDNWPEKLRHQINNAKIVIAVIGPEWVKISDQWGQRRLDDPKDWVRKEIETALTSGAKLIPVIVRGAVMPPPEVLPASLQEITNKQSIEIRRDYWDHDVKLLLAQLVEEQGFLQSDSSNDPFPLSPYSAPAPISEQQLDSILEQELPDWSQVETSLAYLPDKMCTEITRVYKFKSFRSAIHFMNEVAPGCDIAQHHPRWENVWKTLTVFLSTWDDELHNVTDRDIKLARYLDRVHEGFGD